MALSFVILAFAVLAVFSGVHGQSTYDPDTQNVYHLFTRQNPTVSQPMLLNYPTLIGSNFNNTRRNAVIIHSWDSGPTSPFNLALVPAILAAIDVNLIAVDWSAGSAEDDYNDLISNNVPICGESIARFVFWLNLQTGATVDQYHIVGFEVGAHMAGIVGRNLNGLVSFITALNPPRQGWNATNMFVPTDGIFTEAIHTDIFGTGMMEPVADADFYPNGGLVQPGCTPFQWECSRDRSFQYYAESLVSGGFTATLCETAVEAISGNCDSEETLVMGVITNRTGSSGVYYLTTNAQFPFSTG